MLGALLERHVSGLHSSKNSMNHHASQHVIRAAKETWPVSHNRWSDYMAVKPQPQSCKSHEPSTMLNALSLHSKWAHILLLIYVFFFPHHTPSSALRDQFWQGSGDCCDPRDWILHVGYMQGKQVPCLLYYLFSPLFSFLFHLNYLQCYMKILRVQHEVLWEQLGSWSWMLPLPRRDQDLKKHRLSRMLSEGKYGRGSRCRFIIFKWTLRDWGAAQWHSDALLSETLGSMPQ